MWSKEDILKLIEIYRDNDCLWNYKSKNYKRVHLKNIAWENIRGEFPEYSTEDIKKKIKSLKDHYNKAKKKVELSRQSEEGDDDEYIPSLFYYSAFQFLDAAIEFRKTANMAKENMSSQYISEKKQDDIKEEIYVEHVPNSEVEIEGTSTEFLEIEPLRQKRKLEIESEISNKYVDAMDALLGIVKQLPPKDIFTAFADGASAQLRNLPFEYAHMAMADIQTTISKYALKALEERNHRKHDAEGSSTITF